MDPLTFLKEEFESVEKALNETLRHDYGPERSSEYFTECKERLAFIQDALNEGDQMDRKTIADHMRALSALGSRISLIERSHLGEFSWPFGEAIRKVATILFKEQHLDRKYYAPIVHVIAEGMGYQIVDEALPQFGKRRIVVVAFPRQLKHHVLLHPIFGHELGHTAYGSDVPGRIINFEVTAALASEGPLSSPERATSWLKGSDAPGSIRGAMALDPTYVFENSSLVNWRTEIICDLFGLILFGPSFAAAHRAILEPICETTNDFDLDCSSHPPYAVRRRVIISAMKAMKWNAPVTSQANCAFHDAEVAMLDYAMHDDSSDWATVLAENQLERVLEKIGKIFNPHPGLAFEQPTQRSFIALLERLTLARPPILQRIDTEGVAEADEVPTNQCLYAGWSYWFGREKLRTAMLPSAPGLRELTFFETNRLCDYALLQQRAINLKAAYERTREK